MPSVAETAPTEEQIRDKEFAKALHGAQATDTTGYMAILKKNSAAQKQAASTYFQFWDRAASNDTDDDVKARSEKYTDLVNAYYNLATDLYEYGWAESFHFCRFYKGEGFHQALARHEHYMAMKLGIKPGEVVLDVGCGVGGPAREIATFTDANVVGLNNNDYQYHTPPAEDNGPELMSRIERATCYTAKRGLSANVTFVKGDFMKMPFADNAFDRIYSIEATCHAPSLKGVYSEIFRVLKPGGTYATYEWLLNDSYDPKNPRHKQISYDIEAGDGIPAMVKKEVARKAFADVGFEIIHDEDLADRGDEIPWYYPLAGELKYVRSIADFVKVGLMTRPMRYISHGFLGVLAFFRLAPPDANKTADALGVAADALVAGGRANLFTPMQLYVARKPEQ